MSATYLDLLNSDGTVNVAVFASVLESRIATEVNLRLVTAAGLRTPRGLGYEAARLWRAATAKTLDQSLVGHDERARVAAYEADELNQWVNAMQRAAVKMRAAMTPVLEAAE